MLHTPNGLSMRLKNMKSRNVAQWQKDYPNIRDANKHIIKGHKDVIPTLTFPPKEKKAIII